MAHGWAVGKQKSRPTGMARLVTVSFPPWRVGGEIPSDSRWPPSSQTRGSSKLPAALVPRARGWLAATMVWHRRHHAANVPEPGRGKISFMVPWSNSIFHVAKTFLSAGWRDILVPCFVRPEVVTRKSPEPAGRKACATA